MCIRSSPAKGQATVLLLAHGGRDGGEKRKLKTQSEREHLISRVLKGAVEEGDVLQCLRS